MPSPSEGSLSSGGMDQGSDAPTQDYDVEVSEEIVTLLGMVEGVLCRTSNCLRDWLWL